MDEDLIHLLIDYFTDREEQARLRLNAWLSKHGHETLGPGADCCWLVYLLPTALANELACDFAEHVLVSWEKLKPSDARLRSAVAVRRAWLRGQASLEEWRGAWQAACSAREECQVLYWCDEANAWVQGPGEEIAYACSGPCLLTSGAEAAFLTSRQALLAARACALAELSRADAAALQQQGHQAWEREERWQREQIVQLLRRLSTSRQA